MFRLPIGFKIEQIGSSDLEGKPDVDMEKLKNLTKRQNVYGDITQNASPEELENLLRYHENHVPDVSSLTTYLLQCLKKQKKQDPLYEAK